MTASLGTVHRRVKAPAGRSSRQDDVDSEHDASSAFEGSAPMSSDAAEALTLLTLTNAPLTSLVIQIVAILIVENESSIMLLN